MSLPPFQRIVETYGPQLLRFCASRAGPRRAEDVFQETLLSALRAYPSLRDPAAIRPWLYSIAARKAIDAFRAEARAPTSVEDVEQLMPGTEAAPRVDGEIWTEVKQLPDKQRHAVGLRFLADLTHAEIAVAMGTSEPAARRNLFEGLRRLRQTAGNVDLTFSPSSSSN